MTNLYGFVKSPNKDDPYYGEYMRGYEYYKAQQIEYGNDPGDVFGYYYDPSQMARLYGISKRATRRLISRWIDEGVMVDIRRANCQ
jgi:hypothetical protein